MCPALWVNECVSCPTRGWPIPASLAHHAPFPPAECSHVWNVCTRAGLLGVLLDVESSSVGGSCSLRVCIRESPALKITMPKTASTAKAKARGRGSKRRRHARPPPADRHTCCAGSGLESLCRSVATPLCRCAAMSLRRYVATPLCRYAAMSLCRYVAVPRVAHARVRVMAARFAYV